MPVSIDPSTEACQALVTEINRSGAAYTLAATAVYREELIDPLEEISALRVDVATGTSGKPQERLDGLDCTSHNIRVWIRKPCKVSDQTTIDALKLLVAQIAERLDAYVGTRVKIWEVRVDQAENPDKNILKNAGLFVSSIALRVEVDPP